MPGIHNAEDPEDRELDIRKWVKALNEWMQAELAAWVLQPPPPPQVNHLAAQLAIPLQGAQIAELQGDALSP